MDSQERTVVTCEPPQVDHLEKYGYLFGYPIAHSLSPLFHKTIFDSLDLNWDYFLLPSTDISQFIRLVRDPNCYGSGVTMPNKVAIIPHLDDITLEGEAVGACNTIFKRGSRLVGTNTDTIGIRESFLQNVPDQVWRGRPGLVFGGGGAARSAVYALVKYMHCDTVYLVNRDPREVRDVMKWCKDHCYGDGLVHVSTVAQAELRDECGAVVACVPNCTPRTEAEIEARRILQCFLSKGHKGALLEMCYHPTVYTEISDLAERLGWDVLLGTEAMIYQGFEQSRYWTGREYEDLPVQRVKDVIARELERAHL